MKSKKITFLILFCFIISCSSSLSLPKNLSISIPSCNVEFNSENNDLGNLLSNLYIVGHAYGKPGEGKFFPNRLTDYFEQNLDRGVINYIGLTGDFVRIPNKESFTKVKEFISNNFDEYFIAVGNHELDNGDIEEYLIEFEKDLFLKEFNNFSLISANFSTSNWLPKYEQINQINNFFNSTKNQNIIILSHQIFWLEEARGKLKPNSDDLLNSSLPKKSLSWIDNYEEKNIIVISGDYGAYGENPYCLEQDKRLFIANGIGDTNLDKILKIEIREFGFKIVEQSLN